MFLGGEIQRRASREEERKKKKKSCWRGRGGGGGGSRDGSYDGVYWFWNKEKIITRTIKKFALLKIRPACVCTWLTVDQLRYRLVMRSYRILVASRWISRSINPNGMKPDYRPQCRLFSNNSYLSVSVLIKTHLKHVSRSPVSCGLRIRAVHSSSKSPL